MSAQLPKDSRDTESLGTEPGAMVRGVVVNSIDGQPVPLAHVRLSTDHFSASLESGEDGHFEFHGVKPGKGYISANKPGFLQEPLIGLTGSIAIEAKDKDVEVKLALTPGAEIAGSIRDELREPVKGLEVIALHRVIRNGLYTWLVAKSAVTNSQGAYRIQEMLPGTYLLKTELMPDPQEAHLQNRTMNTEVRHGFAATYYPRVSNAEDAKAIMVAVGEHVTADWNLTRQKFLRVTVPYSAETPDHLGTAGFSTTDFDGDVVPVSTIWDYVHRNFVLYAPKGSYRLYVEFGSGNDDWKDGSRKPYVGVAEFTVTDEPLTTAEIPLQHPISIPIHIRTQFAREAQSGEDTKTHTAIRPRDACFGLTGRRNETYIDHICWRLSTSDQSHSLDDVMPGSYSVRAGRPGPTPRH